MRNCGKWDDKIKDDPFMLTEHGILERKLIEEYLPPNADDVLTPRQARVMAQLPGYPWEYETNDEEFWKLVLAGALGTMSLIIPMILMLFAATNKGTRVAVVIPFTVAFAAGTAYRWKPAPMELFQATAAYTAVLVVFVGATS